MEVNFLMMMMMIEVVAVDAIKRHCEQSILKLFLGAMSLLVPLSRYNWPRVGIPRIVKVLSNSFHF